jgi:DNA-binding CsgD family transcriptional regulator
MTQESGDDTVRAVRVELTERQREVLRLIAAGKTNPEIGEALGISLDGAKWHVREIMAKLDVSTREEAGEWWQAHEGLRSRVARALRSIVPASLWLRVGLGVAVVGGGAAVVIGLVTLGGFGSSQKGAGPPGSATHSVTDGEVTGVVKSISNGTHNGTVILTGPTIVLTDGTTVQMGPHSGIADRTQPIAMSDLKVGDAVSVIAQRDSNESMVASVVTQLSEPVASAALVGPAAGQTLGPDGRFMILGSIIARDATSLQLVYPGGVAIVIFGAGCLVQRDSPAGPIEPGVKITVTISGGLGQMIRIAP